MTSREQPERLSVSADASDPLVRALRASAGEGPGSERLASIGRGLEQAMLQGAGASSVAAPRASGGAAKVLAPLLVLGGVAWLLSSAPAAVPVAAPVPRAAVPAVVALPPSVSAAPASPGVAPLPAVAPRPAPWERATAVSRPTVPVEPPDELTLLRAAQAQLASGPALALETLAEHQHHFPRGALAQEREVLVVDALLSLGRLAEARVRADALQLAFPETPHRRRVQRLFERHGAVPVPVEEVP
jgi:hypothetical protein